jgi:signal transduction histidine kinase
VGLTALRGAVERLYRLFTIFLSRSYAPVTMLDVVSTPLTVRRQFDIPARRIAGTPEERLEQIDEAIQELLDVKRVECAGDRLNVRFLAVPRHSHWLGMTVTLAVLLVTLLLLLGVRSAHALNFEMGGRYSASNR